MLCCWAVALSARCSKAAPTPQCDGWSVAARDAENDVGKGRAWVTSGQVAVRFFLAPSLLLCAGTSAAERRVCACTAERLQATCATTTAKDEGRWNSRSRDGGADEQAGRS